MAGDSENPSPSTPDTDTTTQDLTPPSTVESERKHDKVDSEWGEFIEVLVGADECKFIVHTHILRRVPFFRGCLDAPMKESQEGVVRLPEADADAFRQVVHWLYHGRLGYEMKAVAEKKVACLREMSTMIRTYLLAQMWLLEELQNTAIDNIGRGFAHVSPGQSALEIVCGETTDDNPLRRMVMGQLARRISFVGGWSAWKESKDDETTYKLFARKSVDHLEFVMDCISRFPNSTNPINPNDPCQWHIHVETTKCNNTG